MPNKNKQKKKYRTTRVKDPVSDNHVVPLYPNQDFVVCLSPYFGDVAIQVESDFFELSKTKERRVNKEAERVLQFTQKRDLTLWSQISRVYLGNVLLLSEMRDDFVNLSVILESINPNKKNIITVINPEHNKLKVEAHHILEVVLYDATLGAEDTWHYNIVSGDNQIKYELLAHEVLTPDLYNSPKEEELDSLYCLCPRVPSPSFGAQTHEHHFWFRLDAPSINSLCDLSPKTYSAGKLIFDGSCESGSYEDAYYFLEMQLNLTEKNRSNIIKARLIPSSYNELPKFTDGGLRPPLHSLPVASRSSIRRSYIPKSKPKIKVYSSYSAVRPNKIKLKEKTNSDWSTGCKVVHIKRNVLTKGT